METSTMTRDTTTIITENLHTAINIDTKLFAISFAPTPYHLCIIINIKLLFKLMTMYADFAISIFIRKTLKIK